MARRAISMTELIETIYQWHAGASISAVGRSLGLSRNTVKKYLGLAKKAGIERGRPLPDRSELAVILSSRSEGGCLPNRAAPAQAKLAEHHDWVKEVLKDRDITAKQIWRLLLEEHQCQVGYSSVKRYLREHFPWSSKAPVMRLVVPPGRQAQVDFGYAGLMFDPESGRKRKAWAFIMVLSHSRHRFVRFVFRQDVLTWVDCHRRAFEFFGGVPETIVLDNLKAGVLKPDIYDPTLNRSYAECERHYGFLADPAKVRMARHKGKVERLVRVVRQQVLAGRRFQDIHEANRRALTWCRDEVGMRVHGTTQRKPYEHFMLAEKAALKPLPAEPFECPLWKECTVHSDQHVFFERAFYSLPSRYIGRKVWVRGGIRLVRIFLDEQLVKTHPRAPYPGFRRTDDADLPAPRLAYVMPVPTKLRAKAKQMGDHVHEVVDLLLKQHTIKNLRKVQGIMRLGDKYGPGRLDLASKRGLIYGKLTIKGLRHILEKGLDRLTAEEEAERAAPLSDQGLSFLRPGAYYAETGGGEEASS